MHSTIGLANGVFIAFQLFDHPVPADLNSTASCADVRCPIDSSNSALSNCRVDDTTILHVGINTYHSDLLDGSLAWTQGVSRFNASSGDSNSSIVQRSIYLGAQPGQLNSSDGPTGCAILITADQDSGNVTLFSGDHANNDRGWIGSACGQPGPNGIIGLPDECLATLKQRAIGAMGAAGDSCLNVADSLESEVIDSCNPDGSADVAGGRTSFLGRSSKVYAVPLSGSNAPQPLTAAQNSTSNCWPTLPQSNELSEVFAFNISTTGVSDDVDMALAGITPLLNVLSSGGDTEFEAICTRPRFLTTQDAETARTSAGNMLSYSKTALVVLAFAVAMLCF